jgi:hypothetical protein
LPNENLNIAHNPPSWIDIVNDFSKDMNLLGWKVESSIFPNEQALIDFVQGMYTKDRGMLVELLYRMNISENEMGQALANADQSNFASIYCRKIIERSIQRIELRKRFSS